MKLRGFIWCLYGILAFILLLKIWWTVTKPQDAGNFGTMLSLLMIPMIIITSGLELVRSELADLRRAIDAKD